MLTEVVALGLARPIEQHATSLSSIYDLSLRTCSAAVFEELAAHRTHTHISFRKPNIQVSAVAKQATLLLSCLIRIQTLVGVIVIPLFAHLALMSICRFINIDAF